MTTYAYKEVFEVTMEHNDKNTAPSLSAEDNLQSCILDGMGYPDDLVLKITVVRKEPAAYMLSTNFVWLVVAASTTVLVLYLFSLVWNLL